nr:oligosaccharyltransferase complex subunit ostc-A-like [Coffea arabica]
MGVPLNGWKMTGVVGDQQPSDFFWVLYSEPSRGARKDPIASAIDPFFHVLKILPYSFLRPPRLRLKLPSFTLPSTMTIYALILLTYFLVVSGLVYDVIVESPGIGSTQDPRTGSVRPVVFLPGRVNGQYIIEGLSSGFMFVLGGIGIVLLDLALDKNRAKSVKVSFDSRSCWTHCIRSKQRASFTTNQRSVFQTQFICYSLWDIS